VIASSAGGPQALRIFLQRLPAHLPIGGVIVQHISAGFSKMLAVNLSAICGYEIREAEPGDQICQGQFLVAPGGYHLAFDALYQARLIDAPPLNSVKPAANITMQSLAPLYGSRLIGLVFSGLGQDGLDGAHTIVEYGGTVLAQDRQSSMAYFMPRAVTEAGLARITGTPEQLARLIAARSTRSLKES
jgi:two-component system chemotaxis response regulator CheB